MTRGAYYSAGLHVAVIILALLGLPSFFDDDEPEPMVLTVELLPITKISNVPPSQKPLAPKKEEQQKKGPATPPKKSNAPLPPKKEAVKVPEKKIEKKPAEKPKPKKPEEKPEEKPEVDALDDILKDVRNEAMDPDANKKEVKKPAAPTNIAKSNAPYDPSLPMSISEMDAIRGQFVKCWRVPAGAKNDYELKVHVNVQLRPDGSVISAQLAGGDLVRYNTDTFFRGAADSAIRAVHKCSPLKNLPADKYSTWKDMELTFDPRDLLY